MLTGLQFSTAKSFTVQWRTAVQWPGLGCQGLARALIRPEGFEPCSGVVRPATRPRRRYYPEVHANITKWGCVPEMYAVKWFVGLGVARGGRERRGNARTVDLPGATPQYTSNL